MNQNNQQYQFATLLQAHRGIVYKIIKTYCANDKWLQDDLFQDISLKAWEAYNTFTGKSQFSSWLWIIARNTAIDRLRRLKQNKAILVENIFWEIADTPYEEPAQRVRLASVFASLTVPEKRTLEMRMAGKSFAEISEQTGEPISRLTVRMHRIKKTLAESIKKGQYE